MRHFFGLCTMVKSTLAKNSSKTSSRLLRCYKLEALLTSQREILNDCLWYENFERDHAWIMDFNFLSLRRVLIRLDGVQTL